MATVGRKTIMNVITSPELLADVNKQNIRLLNDFKLYLHSIGRSYTTVDAYESDIKIAWVWCLQNNDNKFFVDWTKRDIIAYQNYLMDVNHNSPARVRRLKASLSSLSNYIENILDDEYPNFRNIVSRVEAPTNQPVREKTIITEEQIHYMLDDLTNRKRYKQACLLALALYSGRRKSELTRFRVNDFTEDRLVCDGALYKTHKIKTKGRGIEGKQLECFCLAKQFKPYLDRWLEDRKEKGINSEWLFPKYSNPDEHITIATMNLIADQFTRHFGVNFYWHAIRHMTVTMFKRAGIPDTVIQTYIGWSDISMVPVYSDIPADEQLGMYFTKDGIAAPKSKSLDEI